MGVRFLSAAPFAFVAQLVERRHDKAGVAGSSPAKSTTWPVSSMVEHTAVNRGVVGSSPTRAAKIQKALVAQSRASVSYTEG